MSTGHSSNITDQVIGPDYTPGNIHDSSSEQVHYNPTTYARGPHGHTSTISDGADEANFGDELSLLFDDELDAQFGDEEIPSDVMDLESTSTSNKTNQKDSREPHVSGKLEAPSQGKGESTTGNTNSVPHPLEISNRAAPCIYNGARCYCVTSDHVREPSLPSNSVSHIDQSCGILSILKLKFHKLHRYILCSCHDGSFLELSNLKSHLKDKHKDNIRDGDGRTMNRDFSSVVDHIANAFGIPATQMTKSFEKEDFDGPIAGIREPIKSYLCYWPSCKSYHTNLESARTHHKQTHPTAPFEQNNLAIHLTQHPFASKGSRARRVPVDSSKVVLNTPAPKATEDLGSSLHRYIAPKAIEDSPWLVHVGWMVWRDDLIAKHHSVPDLCALVALPRQVSKRFFPGPVTGERLLFLISSRIRVRGIKMLKDANTWLGSSELRDAITKKYV
jgi:hypothetical protein